MAFDDNIMFYGIILFSWIEYIWSVYLSWRQFRVVKKTTEIPPRLTKVMDKETFDQSKSYLLSTIKFKVMKKTSKILITTVKLYYGILDGLWEFVGTINPYKNEVIRSCHWLSLVMTLQQVVDLPLIVYNTFVLEEKFGFNRQTLRFFIIDKAKGWLILQSVVLPIASLIVLIVKFSGDMFFMWLCCAVATISMFLFHIYPTHIAPLFNKYTVMPEGELREKLEELASELNFPLNELYIVNKSTRTKKSDASIYGLFSSNKQIVLNNNMVEDCKMNIDTIVASVAQQLGHWYFGHITKSFIFMQLNFFVLLAVFSMTFKSPMIYKVVGFKSDAKPILVGLIVILDYVTMPYKILLKFMQKSLARRFEFKADAFAANLGKAEDLKKALVQLYKHNLTFPVDDRLYSVWYYESPTLLERLNALDDDKTH